MLASSGIEECVKVCRVIGTERREEVKTGKAKRGFEGEERGESGEGAFVA